MNLLHFDLPHVARVNPNAPRSETETDFHQAVGEGRGAIAERLRDLDDEWTIEGMFEVNAAVVGVATFALGLAVDDRWLVLPLILSVLLLQQTLQGWCPLLPLLRGLGFRTEREIQHERHVLQQMEEERAEGHRPVWTHMESSPIRESCCASTFSLQDFLLGSAR